MIPRLILIITLASACAESALQAADPKLVSFPTSDHGLIFGNLYGGGDRCVVFAHGAVFDKESWDPQARALSRNGYEVLAIDFRGYGKSRSGDDHRALHEDTLAAIRFMKKNRCRSTSIVGASLGANAAALASIHSKKGDIDRLILIAPPGVPRANEMKANLIVFIVSRGDRFYRGVIAAHHTATQPKALEILDGEAHAQHIFKSDQGDNLLRLILKYLSDE